MGAPSRSRQAKLPVRMRIQNRNQDSHSSPPFGGPRYPPATRPGVSDDYLSSVTQSQHVLSHPLRDTPTRPMPKIANLTVIRPLDIGNSRGAQVLLCSARQASHTQPFTAVAKIYDPLYYSFSASLAMGTPVDVVWRAESDYSKEAAAYEHLDEVHLSGGFAPKYFGSWTFTLPLKVSNKIHQRSVRLVLMEYIDGTSMLNVFAQNQGPHQERDAFHLDLGYRLEVLARLLDGVVRQSHAGLGQRDLAPRNVMLSPPPSNILDKSSLHLASCYLITTIPWSTRNRRRLLAGPTPANCQSILCSTSGMTL